MSVSLDLIGSPALDSTVSTAALRLSLGLYDTVLTKSAGKDRDRAYLSQAEVTVLSGVDPRTVPEHLDDLAKIGLVILVSTGSKGQIVDDRPGAGAWVTG